MTTTLLSPANRLGQTKEYYFSSKLREIAQLKTAGRPIINLGIGSPDLPPHPTVVEALVSGARAAGNHGYQSYVGMPELRAAFAAWYQRWFNVSLNPDDEILPLIGSKEGIMHLSMAFLNPGDEVLVPNPGYPTYRSATELAGGKIREYQLSDTNNWLPDLEALSHQALDKVKIMWINYPHMPTGTQAPDDFFEDLVAFAKRHEILLVNDNPYAFILTEERKSLLSVPGAEEVTLELTSLSKAQNMAGWRVGALMGNAELLKTVLRFKSNVDSGQFKPVQLAAIKALELGQEWYDELNAIYRERRELVYRIFDRLGCEYDRKQVGLFVWAKVPIGKSGYEISDYALYEKDLFLTPGGIFGSQGKQYARISLCSPKETLKEALDRLSD